MFCLSVCLPVSLRHLRISGFSETELAMVCKTVIRPTLDYCADVYHPMITDKQDQVGEDAGASAMKTFMDMGWAMQRWEREWRSPHTGPSGLKCVTSLHKKPCPILDLPPGSRSGWCLGGAGITSSTRNWQHGQTDRTIIHCISFAADWMGRWGKDTRHLSPQRLGLFL